MGLVRESTAQRVVHLNAARAPYLRVCVQVSREAIRPRGAEVDNTAVPELVVTVPFVYPMILWIVAPPASKRARVGHGEIVGKPLR